ncbi:MAG: GAP1-N2 domain-containing protein [Planctomycetota bacterium]|jgi:hypothetical protein
MPATTFDQAIFTSVRTPMGEGYRIIAASAALRSDEKQVITRFSPSHQGLCMEPSNDPAQAHEYDELVPGLAYYKLPTGRCCLAISTFAGAEHTARGGQRIYTHNLVFSESELKAWEFNPLNIARAAVAAGLVEPQLKPEQVLPQVDLEIPAAKANGGLRLPEAVRGDHGRHLLCNMLVGNRSVLSVDAGWLQTLELLLLGLPGPLRCDLSFAAGLQFSASRTHTLTILHDAKGQARKRMTGQQVEYVDPDSSTPVETFHSPWLEFVQYQWDNGDATSLSQRSSRSFADVGPEHLNQVGRAYIYVARASTTDLTTLLAQADDCLSHSFLCREPGIAQEARQVLSQAILGHVSRIGWDEGRQYMDQVLVWWNGSESSARFAAPILESLLDSARKKDLWDSAKMLSELSFEGHCSAVQAIWDRMIDDTIAAVAVRCQSAGDEIMPQLIAFCHTWSAHRPDSPAMKMIKARCEAHSETPEA